MKKGNYRLDILHDDNSLRRKWFSTALAAKEYCSSHKDDNGGDEIGFVITNAKTTKVVHQGYYRSWDANATDVKWMRKGRGNVITAKQYAIHNRSTLDGRQLLEAVFDKRHDVVIGGGGIQVCIQQIQECYATIKSLEKSIPLGPYTVILRNRCIEQSAQRLGGYVKSIGRAKTICLVDRSEEDRYGNEWEYEILKHNKRVLISVNNQWWKPLKWKEYKNNK